MGESLTFAHARSFSYKQEQMDIQPRDLFRCLRKGLFFSHLEEEPLVWYAKIRDKVHLPQIPNKPISSPTIDTQKC